jgi:O-antigen ligase
MVGIYNLGNASLLKILVLIGIYSTFTNILPLSALFAVALGFFGLKKITPLALSIYSFFLYLIISGLIFNSSQFLEYHFYRYDGNIFISYIPFLSAGLLNLNDPEKNLKKIVYFFMAISIFMILLNFILNDRLLLNQVQDGFLYYFSFLTNNAAGGWLSIIAILSIFMYLKTNKLIFLIAALIQLAVLYTLNSRGSLYSLAASLFIYYLHKKTKISFGKIYVLLLSSLLIIQLGGVYTFSMDSYYEISNINEYLVNSGVSLKEANVSMRIFYTWPKALDLFIKFPFFGAGFGSFNDILTTSPYISYSSQMINNDAHAHSTYLQFLAETGIFGLILFFNFLYSLYKYISFKSNQSLYKEMLLTISLMIALVSFTEDRFTAPSMIFIFSFLVVLLTSSNKCKLKKNG